MRKKIDRKDKKCFRAFVWLSEAEHAHLCELLGKEATEKWIDELNLYLGSKGDKYESHYYTIQVWARRAAKAAPSPTSPARGEATAANRAADRVIEALRDVTGRYMPDFDEKTTTTIYAVLKTRRATWPRLHDECREDPEAAAGFREAFLKAYC